MTKTSTARPTRLRFTWFAMLACVYVLLTMPASIQRTSGLEQVLFWPTRVLLDWFQEWRGWRHPSTLPLGAATQILLMGLAADLLCLRRRFRWSWLAATDPLAPWKAILLSTLVAVTIAFWSLREYDMPFLLTDPKQEGQWVTARRADLQAQVDATRRRDPEVPLIMVVGDSLARSAFKDPAALGQRVKETSGQTVQVEYWTVGRLQLVDLEPHGDRLVALQPDLVMIESNVLFLATARALAIGRVLRAQRWAHMALDSASAALTRLGWSPDDATHRFEGEALGFADLTGRFDDPNMKFRELRWFGREATYSDPSYRYCRSLFEQLSRHGIHAMIFVVPPSERLQTISARFLADRRRMATELTEEWNGTFYPYENEVSDQWYEDGAHLNESGRDHYCRWLAPRLAALIEALPDGR